MGQDPPQSPAVRPSGQDVQSTVESVFRDPELANGLRPPSELGSIGQLIEWARSVFFSWVDWITQLRVESPGLFILLFAVLVVTLILMIWHIVYTMRRVFGARTAEGRAPRAVESELRVRHSSELRARARELAEQQQFREAARHLLLALLAILEERRIVHVAGGWTNREILGRVAARCGGSAELQTFGRTLEHSSYGGMELERSGFGDLEAIFDHLRTRLHRGSPHGASAHGGRS